MAEDSGFPPADRARWFYNGREIKGHPVTSAPSSTGGSHHHHRRRHESATLKVHEAGVGAAGNYSCIPYNSVGTALKTTEGIDDDEEEAAEEAISSISVEVHTAPTLIKSLAKRTGKQYYHKAYSQM